MAAISLTKLATHKSCASYFTLTVIIRTLVCTAHATLGLSLKLKKKSLVHAKRGACVGRVKSAYKNVGIFQVHHDDYSLDCRLIGLSFINSQTVNF